MIRRIADEDPDEPGSKEKSGIPNNLIDSNACLLLGLEITIFPGRIS